MANFTGTLPNYPTVNNADSVYPTPDKLGFPKSGLLFLRNVVHDYFIAYDVPATVAEVGLRYRSFTLNQQFPNNANRIVFIPGEFAGEDKLQPRKYGQLSRDGEFAASSYNPRELLAWFRPFTLSVWAAPPISGPRDEGGSLNMAEDLLEMTIRACHSAQQSSIIWGDITIMAPPTEMAFGTELLVSAIQKVPIFDATLDVVQATAHLPRGTET